MVTEKLNNARFVFLKNVGPDMVFQNQELHVIAGVLFDGDRHAVGVVVPATTPEARLAYIRLREALVAKFGQPTNEGYAVGNTQEMSWLSVNGGGLFVDASDSTIITCFVSPAWPAELQRRTVAADQGRR